MKRIKHRGSVDTKELARLIQEGKWTRALRIAERIRSHPDLPDWFHSSRGLILQKLGKARAALHAYEEALVRDPLSWDAQFNSAVLLFECGFHGPAIKRLERCIETGAHEKLARTTLAKIHISREDPLAAFEALPETVGDSAYCQEVRRLKAAAFSLIGDQSSAVSELNRVINAQPRSSDLVERARCFIYQGLFDAAELDIRVALALDAQNSEALFLLSHYFEADTDELLELASCVKRNNLSEGGKAILLFVEGQISSKRDRFDEAFKRFSMANKLLAKTSKYRFTTHLQYLCGQSQMRLSESFQSELNDSEAIVPIFIVGMPRTGSSLLAAKLGEFQDFGTCGESSALSRLFHEFSPSPGQSISKSAGSRIRKEYLQWLKIAAPEKRFVIDKAPGNIFRLKILLDIFPEALFLVTERDVKETLWANFKQPFGKHLGFTYSLENLAKVYRLHNEILSDITGCNRVIRVELSKLAESPELILSGILEKLCVDYSLAARSSGGGPSIRTASARQVRDVNHRTRSEVELLPEKIQKTITDFSLKIELQDQNCRRAG